MIENEFKIMLSKEQYEKLLGMYDFKTVVQVNHYYDTDDLQMSERHITVRVRELNDKFFLQMKLPANAEFSRVELEKELNGVPEILAGFVLTAVFDVDCPELKHIGTLKTTRSIWKFDGGEIDLDFSEYFDKSDYELEIEFTDEKKARSVLSEIKEKLGISESSEVCTGKVRRFLEEYKKRRK